MYRLVDEAECKKYRSDCSATLNQVRSILREKGITSQFTLVGSGARNMVTRDGDGPFDLDYNLEIIKALDEYWNDLHHLKDTVRVALDKAVGIRGCFSESQDSTSCLTTLLHFDDEPSVKFSFDVAIVAKNSKGTLCRLLQNKNGFGIGNDQYIWNEVPDSHDVAQKVKQIKSKGLWLEVRERYVDLKNMYLSRQDKNHPSFIVYVEAVNQVYNKYFCQRFSGYKKAMVIKLR